MKKLTNTILPFLVFAIVAFLYLAFTSQDLFFVVQSQDIFVYDIFHFNLIAEMPGFVPVYVGSFLTQFAYYPIYGILIFVFLLTGLAVLIAWAFKIPQHSYALTLIPSLLILLYILRWDYGIFASRHYGNLYSTVLGLIVQTTIIGFYVRIKTVVSRYLLTFLTVVIGYPLFGCFALMATALAILIDIVLLRRFIWFLSLFAIVIFIFIPMIEVRVCFISFNTKYMLMAGLPYLDFYRDISQLVPLYLSLIAVALLSVSSKMLNALSAKIGIIFSAFFALITTSCVCIYVNRDSNFHTLIAIEHAYGICKTDKVLELSAIQSKPIRSIIMYRNIELYRRGELLDKMFQYSWESDTIVSKNERMNTYISGPRVFQEYTFWNFSYRWAMEHYVKYKPSYTDMQIMAKDAIYNDETELADKYLLKLENTLFYKDWAKEQRKLLDSTVLHQESIYKLHKQIVVLPYGAIDNTEFCEYMLLSHFCRLYINTPQRAVLSLAASLITNNEKVFWQLCLVEVKTHRNQSLPKHVQEAALLFALKRQNSQLLAQIELMVGKEGDVCQQFIRNQELLTRLIFQPNIYDACTLKSLCPGTYWSYYFNDARDSFVYD